MYLLMLDNKKHPVKAVFGVIHHNCANCDEELDDKVLISESCHYLNNALTKLLNPRTQHIDVNFDIDMRTFANFKLHQQDLDQIQDQDQGSPEKIILTEELVSDNQEIFVISNTICQFLQDQIQSGLRVFNPGLYIIDRQNIDDDLRYGVLI